MPSLSPQATAITVAIAGVDQTAKLVPGSVSITGRLNQRWEASFRLCDTAGSYDPEAGQHVILYETPDGGSPQRCFTGMIEEVTVARVVNNSLGSELFLEITCVDLMARLEQRVCSEPSTHRGLTCGELVFFAMENFAWSEGIGFALAASPGGFIESGPTVEKYVFNKQTVAEVIEDMRKLADKVGFIDVNGDLHFEDVGATMAAPFSISATSANFSKIAVRRSKSEGAGSAGSGYFNQSFTRTAWAAWEQRYNTFTGDGSTTEWTLYDPASSPASEMLAAVVVDVKVNGKSVDLGGEEEGRAYTWSYGESTLTQDSGEAVLTADDTLEVWFHDIAQGYIFVQDLTEITARGTIESNSGQCTRIFDDSQETNFQAATDKAQAALDLSKHIVDVVTLYANGFGPSPIYPRPGMVFSASLSYPSISGDFSIQEVSAQEIAGAGLAYTCKCVTKASSRRLANEIDYFRELARKKPGTTISGGAGDGGPKSGPIPYRTLVKNSAVRVNAADVVSVYGAVIQQVSRVRRIQGVPKVDLTADLEVQWQVVYASGETHDVATVTIPAHSTVERSIAFSDSDFDWPTLPDGSVLKFNILQSSGQKDADGVASFLIETVGRGSGAPLLDGATSSGVYYPDGVYAKGEVVVYNGSAYQSKTDGNTGNTPGESPDDWEILLPAPTPVPGPQGQAAPHGFKAAFTNNPVDGMTAYTSLGNGGTLTSWEIAVTGGGTATVEVWRVAAGSTLPDSGDTLNTSGITNGGTPRVISTDLSDFSSTVFAAGDGVIVHLIDVTGTVNSVNVDFRFGTPSTGVSSTPTPPSGSDDRPTIQSLIDQTPDGGILTIDGAAGVYDIGDTLTIHSRNNLMIRGINGAMLRSQNSGLMSGAYAAMVWLNNCANVLFKDIEIDCNSYPTGGIFMQNSNDCEIQGVLVHDIAYDLGGPPYAGIRTARCLRTRVRNCGVEHTGGVPGGVGVRGIWLGVNETEYDTDIVVDGCWTLDTGHTGMAFEISGGTITNCNVEDSTTQGTAYKLIPRGARKQVLFDNLTATTTLNGGFMLEAGNLTAVKVTVQNSLFTDCGNSGTFGAFYTSGSPNGNLYILNNTFDACGSVGAFRGMTTAVLTNNTITGSEPNRNKLYLEDDCHDITLTSSGVVDVGTNISDVVVDGVVIVP